MAPQTWIWGVWLPISYQYTDPVEQENYCLVFWISATFISKTKIFYVRYRTNTRRHLLSDLKLRHLVLSTDFFIKKL